MKTTTTLALTLTISILTLACGKADEAKSPEIVSGMAVETASLAQGDEVI